MKNIIYLLIFSITILISCSENTTDNNSQKEEIKCDKNSGKKCDKSNKKSCDKFSSKKCDKSKKQCDKKSQKSCDKKPKKGCSSKKFEEHSGGGHHNMELPEDTRVSLNISGMQAEHQLLNMRDHLVVVNIIIGYLANEKYDEASEIAMDRLGYSTEMQMMCNSFGDEFGAIGYDFHKSAETMSEVFKTKDQKKSLEALNTTMGYCISCHAKFKQ